jgi:hypothetical protein
MRQNGMRNRPNEVILLAFLSLSSCSKSDYPVRSGQSDQIEIPPRFTALEKSVRKELVDEYRAKRGLPPKQADAKKK